MGKCIESGCTARAHEDYAYCRPHLDETPSATHEDAALLEAIRLKDEYEAALNRALDQETRERVARQKAEADRDALAEKLAGAEDLIRLGWMRANVITGRGERTPEGVAADLIADWQQATERAETAERLLSSTIRERDDAREALRRSVHAIADTLVEQAKQDGEAALSSEREKVARLAGEIERLRSMPFFVAGKIVTVGEMREFQDKLCPAETQGNPVPSPDSVPEGNLGASSGARGSTQGITPASPASAAAALVELAPAAQADPMERMVAGNRAYLRQTYGLTDAQIGSASPDEPLDGSTHVIEGSRCLCPECVSKGEPRP